MNRTKTLLVFLILLIFISCNEDQTNVINETPPSEKISFSEKELLMLDIISSGSIKSTEEEIINKALDAVNSIYPVSTRSINNKTIETIQPLTSSNNSNSRTRAEANLVDTLAYLLNFNNGGFSIIAADKRVPNQILASTAEGSLQSDTNNPGILHFLELAEDYIQTSIKEYERTQDSLKQVVLNKLRFTENPSTRSDESDESDDEESYDEIEYEYGPWEIVKQVTPLTVVEWGQGHNKYTKSKGCGGNAKYTGCVATALAQVMAYWKYPSSIDGYTIYWNDIIKYTDGYERNYLFNWKWQDYTFNAPFGIKDNVARLMERIGANVGMKYDCDESGAYTSDAVNWLKKIGYLGGEKSDYNFDRVIESLDNKRIVVADGYSIKKKSGGFLGIGKKSVYSKGHAWNYDGYLIQRRSKKITRTTYSLETGYLMDTKVFNGYQENYLLHINWGWSGFQNGYYQSSAFNANERPKMPSNTRSEAAEGTIRNFQYELKIFTNIRK